MLRVVVGGFAGVAAQGIRAILKPPEFALTDCTIDAVVNVVAATQPDALVLNSGKDCECTLAASVARAHPGMTVVACSAEGTAMRVYPRSGGGPVSSRSLSAAALIECVRG